MRPALPSRSDPAFLRAGQTLARTLAGLMSRDGDETPATEAERALRKALDDRAAIAGLGVQLGDRLRGSTDPRDLQLLTALNRWAQGELI